MLSKWCALGSSGGWGAQVPRGLGVLVMAEQNSYPLLQTRSLDFENLMQP